LRYRELISETLINPFDHPYVIIDKEMGILGVSRSSKAPIFTTPPEEGARLGNVLHPYIKATFANLLEQSLNEETEPTGFIQLTGGYICRLQMHKLPSSENGQAFVCFFECHQLASILGPGAPGLRTVTPLSNGFPKTDNIYNKAFHSAPMPLAIFKLKNCAVLEVNNAFLKLGGYTREEIIGANILKLGIWNDTHDSVRIAQLLKDNYFVHNLEIRFRIKNGRAIDTILNLDIVEVDWSPVL